MCNIRYRRDLLHLRRRRDQLGVPHRHADDQLRVHFQRGLPCAGGLFAGIGNVDGTAGADIVAWGAKDGNNFCLVSSGTGAAVRLSTQDMR